MVFLVPFKRIVGLRRFVFPSFPPRAKKDRENNRFYCQQTMRTGREKSSSRFLTGHFLSSPLNYDSTCTKMPRRIREIARRLETPYCEIIRSLPAPFAETHAGLLTKTKLLPVGVEALLLFGENFLDQKLTPVSAKNNRHIIAP